MKKEIKIKMPETYAELVKIMDCRIHEEGKIVEVELRRKR